MINKIGEFKQLNKKLKQGFISPQQFSKQWDELIKKINFFVDKYTNIDWFEKEGYL